MTTVPLGLGAFKRNFAGEPDIRMVNRFMSFMVFTVSGAVVLP